MVQLATIMFVPSAETITVNCNKKNTESELKGKAIKKMKSSHGNFWYRLGDFEIVGRE